MTWVERIRFFKAIYIVVLVGVFFGHKRDIIELNDVYMCISCLIFNNVFFLATVSQRVCIKYGPILL